MCRYLRIMMGTGKTDVAVFRNGAWCILKSSGGSQVVGWGMAGGCASTGGLRWRWEDGCGGV